MVPRGNDYIGIGINTRAFAAELCLRNHAEKVRGKPDRARCPREQSDQPPFGPEPTRVKAVRR